MNQNYVALVGCGAAAEKYYLPAFKRYKEILGDLIIVDIDIGRARKFAYQLGAKKFTADYHEILGEVAGAIIAVPHFIHHEIAIDFVSSGAHVLCEKPLSDTLEGALSVIDQAHKNHVTVSVNNTRRLFPSFTFIKTALSDGLIGQPLSIKYFEGEKFGWESATSFYVNPKISSKGVLLDLGSHALDLICWWLDSKPELVKYEDDSFGGPESVAKLTAKRDSCDIQVYLNRLVDLPSHYLITGELGYLKGSIYDWHSVEIHLKSNVKKKITFKNSLRTYPEFVQQLIANFINVIKNKQSPLISGESVLASIDFIQECYHNRSQFDNSWFENLERLMHE